MSFVVSHKNIFILYIFKYQKLLKKVTDFNIFFHTKSNHFLSTLVLYQCQMKPAHRNSWFSSGGALLEIVTSYGTTAVADEQAAPWNISYHGSVFLTGMHFITYSLIYTVSFADSPLVTMSTLTALPWLQDSYFLLTKESQTWSDRQFLPPRRTTSEGRSAWDLCLKPLLLVPSRVQCTCCTALTKVGKGCIASLQWQLFGHKRPVL